MRSFAASRTTEARPTEARPTEARLIQRRPLLLGVLAFLLASLLVCVPSSAQDAPVWFAQAGADGDGTSAASPLGSTQALESVTSPGDVLVLLPSDAPLEGGISLKPRQTLIGRPDGKRKPVITNADSTRNGGVGIVLAADSRVLNIRIEDTYASGILATNAAGVQVDRVEVARPNRSHSLTAAAVRAMGTSVSHGGIVLLTEASEPTAQRMSIAQSTVSRTAVTDAAGAGIVMFSGGSAQARLTVSETRVEGGAAVMPHDIGIGVVAEGPGAEARLLLADSEVRGRRSPAGRNVIALASAGATANARLERARIADSGQDGVLAVAALTPADVSLDVIDSVVGGAAQTEVEGTILNLPAVDPPSAHQTRMSVRIDGSTLLGTTEAGNAPQGIAARGAGADSSGLFAGQRANVYLGSSATAQQMDSTASAPFPAGRYELEVRDSRLVGALDHSLIVGGSGSMWGIGPETATFDVLLRQNEITTGDCTPLLVRAPEARVDARQNCWGDSAGLERDGIVVEAPAVRSQVDVKEPIPCDALE